ncbi:MULTISPECIES: MFS transporter [Photorhabdus]|uniref:MFS transporter n=1 Tax=Photorhabdus kayaii TaxID=230088 RepID=A0ABX0B611_9GAMM|nr:MULTISPECIES: MFS transporter [Photorhabdus]MCC8374509.1 MFS transporter [Photorhabdus bodei]MCT8354343.1 MFS transporter [Photorhabdus kayaii]MDB6368621.1 MFS transporter [Photorhabdus bodei]NDL12465.1 hypothetical protein [Photorhabdus kayaii]NDL26037.1 hypothetical protein [Photorhabdus kayaii]
MKNQNWLKNIGYLDSTFRAMQSTSNQMSHLLVGALGGMFGAAVSLRVSIAFYSSLFLEIPSGLLADRLGHFKSVALGSWFTTIALLALYCSLATTDNIDAQIALLIFSSFLSAIGMALISGAYQAMLQDLIDYQIVKHGEEHTLRTKAILLSQRYGKEIVSIVPVLFLLVLLVLYRMIGHAETMLFIPAAMFICLGIWLWRFPQMNGMHDHHAKQGIHIARKSMLRHFITHLRGLSHSQWLTLLKLSVVIIFLNFSMVHVHTYLMVSEFREYNIMEVKMIYLVPLFLFIASFDVAHYVKGMIVPRVAAKFSDNSMIIISFVSLMLLSVFCYLLYLYVNGIFALILYVLFFRATVTIGQDVAISNFLARLPEEIRALSLSLVMSTVIVLYGAYSVYLTFTGTGAEPAQYVLLEIAAIALIGGIFAFYLKIAPQTDTKHSELQPLN